MTARKDFPFLSLLGKENGGKPVRAFMVRQACPEFIEGLTTNAI
jgi:hypothetical protein